MTDCRERGDLCRARRVLIDLIERNGIPVFSDMDSCLACSVLNVTQVNTGREEWTTGLSCVTCPAVLPTLFLKSPK